MIPVKEKICIPGSKSYTNRALIMGALTNGPISIYNPLYSDDTLAMIGCLQTLGIRIDTEADTLIVHGDIRNVQEGTYELFVKDSGTTARFMLALLCIVPGVKILQGTSRLNERPIHDLVQALRQLGARIDYCEKEGQLPLKVSSSTFLCDVASLSGSMSSQFCSALLLTAPYLHKDFTLHVTGPIISKPYIDMTLHCMRDWGIEVVASKHGSYFVPGSQDYRKENYTIEGDFSSAGYFFAIAALTQKAICIENLNPHSRQADRKLLTFLEQMGSVVTNGENSVSLQGKGVCPLDIAMEDCPDQVMTMAVLAAFAQGVTTISGIRSLRWKETDRVIALKTELGKMGIRTQDTEDTLTIYGGSPHAAEIETYNDHRIAMAFAVAKMYLPSLVIHNPKVVNKTFPTFWETLQLLQ